MAKEENGAAGEESELPRFFLYATRAALICQWCDTNILDIPEDAALTDLTAATRSHACDPAKRLFGPATGGRIADLVPGTTGSLQQRIAEVVENEVPPAYADLAALHLRETVQQWADEASEAARSVGREMLAGLMPGQTGINMAHEAADRILAAVRISDSGEKE